MRLKKLGKAHAPFCWHSVLLVGLLVSLCAGAEQPPFLRDGKAGFVVSDIRYALGPDADQSGACPDGMTMNVQEQYALTPEGKQQPGESDAEYSDRLFKVGFALATYEDGKNFCLHPENSPSDPYYRSVEANDIPVEGIDLDGVYTKLSSAGQQTGTQGSCSHQDFVGADGTKGVDNQFFRVVGCNRSYQSAGSSNIFATNMYTGSWGILLTLGGVDSLENDADIEVGIYANADPLQLSAKREALPYATYAMDQDHDFRGVTSGRIENGIIYSDPLDIKLRYEVNSMHLERVLRDARLQVSISSDGKVAGILAGYSPVEALYDVGFGYRNGKDNLGQLSPERLRLISSNGAAHVLGHTCNGVYHALYQHADGHPDPETGKCTSISTQFMIEAIPAFVEDIETSSVNDGLRPPGHGGDEY